MPFYGELGLAMMAPRKSKLSKTRVERAHALTLTDFPGMRSMLSQRALRQHCPACVQAGGQHRVPVGNPEGVEREECMLLAPVVVHRHAPGTCRAAALTGARVQVRRRAATGLLLDPVDLEARREVLSRDREPPLVPPGGERQGGH